ncbi:hypothetical protein [Salinibaculum rarum]|uniref:hypothetical protein n=1 Tax=Salinibaculum rarum TaxID=3058903 RepID=UPI00265E1EC3|nr:hypothetical protein [Salinibaculum sp. KK48]
MTAQQAVLGTVTRLGALVGLLQTYAVPVRWNQGPESRWWEPVRRVASRLLGAALDERAGPRPITGGEFAGTLHRSHDEAERLLWTWGFVRSPFARLKTRDGQAELGSWVYRDSPLARRQVHVMLFPAPSGVDVYAHEEPSSVHPLVGAEHFDGQEQHIAKGVRVVRERLPLDTSNAPEEPPAGAWDSRLPE